MNLKTKRIIKLIVLLIFFNNEVFAQFSGFALYNRQGNTTTYLIDENENIAHTWNLSTECNYTVLLKDNGNIVRGTKNNIQTGGTNNSLGGAADAGRVQEIDPNGNVVGFYLFKLECFIAP